MMLPASKRRASLPDTRRPAESLESTGSPRADGPAQDRLIRRDPPTRRERRALKYRARHRRENPTEAETVLWERVRNYQICGVKFFQQHVSGRLIVDFFCAPAGLVIEIRPDGLKWAFREEVEYLEHRGLTVLRFTESEVLEKLDWVLRLIWGVVKDRLSESNPDHKSDSVNAEGGVETDSDHWRDDISTDSGHRRADDVSTEHNAGRRTEDDVSSPRDPSGPRAEDDSVSQPMQENQAAPRLGETGGSFRESRPVGRGHPWRTGRLMGPPILRGLLRDLAGLLTWVVQRWTSG